MTNTDNNITVSFNIDEDAFVRMAMRRVNKSQIAVIVFLFAAVGFSAIEHLTLYAIVWYLIVTLLFVFAALKWITPYSIRRNYRNIGCYNNTRTMTFGKESLSSHTKGVDTQVRYGTLKRMDEDDDYLYLYLNKKNFYFIPKAAFASDEEIEEVKRRINASMKMTS